MLMAEAIQIVAALDVAIVDDETFVASDLSDTQIAQIEAARGADETWPQLRARLTASIVGELGADAVIFDGLVWRASSDGASLVCHCIRNLATQIEPNGD